jgi:hypothetical protein
MKLINLTPIFLMVVMSFLLLTDVTRATTDDELTIFNSLVVQTAVRVFYDPTTCHSGQIPTYTNPKGGHVDCRVSKGNKVTVPVLFSAIAFASLALFGVCKVII